MSVLWVAAAVAMVGVLILVHEFGHFLMARALGIGVETFCLGFGPMLLKKKLGQTLYAVALVPLGGFVKLVGESDQEDVPNELLSRSFAQRPVFHRLLVVLGGPLFNILFALLVFVGLGLGGSERPAAVVGEVLEGTPALAAGIRPGDRILRINGQALQSWGELLDIVQDSKGKPLALEVLRGGNNIRVSVVPRLGSREDEFGENKPAWMIGIAPDPKARVFVRQGLFQALQDGAGSTYRLVKLTFVALYKMFTGALSYKNIAGPIQIFALAGEQARTGLASALFFLAVISVNLGVINLLPIPVLDGGHVLFLTVEGVTGRMPSMKTREIAQQVGLFILLALMLLAFFNDITRILKGGLLGNGQI